MRFCKVQKRPSSPRAHAHWRVHNISLNYNLKLEERGQAWWLCNATECASRECALVPLFCATFCVSVSVCVIDYAVSTSTTTTSDEFRGVLQRIYVPYIRMYVVHVFCWCAGLYSIFKHTHSVPYWIDWMPLQYALVLSDAIETRFSLIIDYCTIRARIYAIATPKWLKIYAYIYTTATARVTSGARFAYAARAQRSVPHYNVVVVPCNSIKVIN